MITLRSDTLLYGYPAPVVRLIVPVRKEGRKFWKYNVRIDSVYIRKVQGMYALRTSTAV